MVTTEESLHWATFTTVSYDYFLQDELCDNSDAMQFGTIWTPVLFSIVVALSFFGNILVIVILAMYENLKSLTNAFILNLAISDLLFTAGLPFWAYYHIYGWNLGEPACKLIHFVYCVGFYSSSILLILMTVHRYIAVMRPLSNIVLATGYNSVLASVIIWAISILISCPAFIFIHVRDENQCVYANSSSALWGTYQQNIFFALSSLVFIFCYSQIICRLLRPTAQKRKPKTLKLIFTLMVVFFMGWAPYNIIIFLQSLYFWRLESLDANTLRKQCEIEKQLEYAFYVSRIFAFSHCCLNPVFYVFVGVKFKNHLKKMLKSFGNNRGSIRSRQNRLTITSLTSGEEFSM